WGRIRTPLEGGPPTMRGIWPGLACVLLTAVCGPAADIPDRKEIAPRALKEPAYNSRRPLYGVLVFGPEARTPVWMVLDRSGPADDRGCRRLQGVRRAARGRGEQLLGLPGAHPAGIASGPGDAHLPRRRRQGAPGGLPAEGAVLRDALLRPGPGPRRSTSRQG